MNNYPPEMYDEILKDWNHRWGKFNPIPYPTVTNKEEKKSELLTNEEFNALNCLIALEQIDIIDDEENEFWNTIRRKLTTNVINEP